MKIVHSRPYIMYQHLVHTYDMIIVEAEIEKVALCLHCGSDGWLTWSTGPVIDL